MLSLLYYSLRALLDSRIPDRLVRAVYELKQLVINGEYPEFFCCTACGSSEKLEGFSIEADGVVCHSCLGHRGVMRISPRNAVYIAVYSDDTGRQTVLVYR